MLSGRTHESGGRRRRHGARCGALSNGPERSRAAAESARRPPGLLAGAGRQVPGNGRLRRYGGLRYRSPTVTATLTARRPPTAAYISSLTLAADTIAVRSSIHTRVRGAAPVLEVCSRCATLVEISNVCGEASLSE